MDKCRDHFSGFGGGGYCGGDWIDSNKTHQSHMVMKINVRMPHARWEVVVGHVGYNRIDYNRTDYFDCKRLDHNRFDYTQEGRVGPAWCWDW